MASNNISKYYKVDNGLDLTSDTQFATLSANEKIVYKPSGEKYIKNADYSNVFDKTNTYEEIEERVNTKVISRIDDADTNGVCSYYNNVGSALGTFKCGLDQIHGVEKISTNVNPVETTANGIIKVCVPRVTFDKFGRITSWDTQSASVVVTGAGSGSGSGPTYTGVKVGTISMWSGSVGDIPEDWSLCDGSNGTPDLRNRFVVGAGSSYNPGTVDTPSGSTTIKIPELVTIEPDDTYTTPGIVSLHSGTSDTYPNTLTTVVGEQYSGNQLYFGNLIEGDGYSNNPTPFGTQIGEPDAVYICLKPSSYTITGVDSSDGTLIYDTTSITKGLFKRVSSTGSTTNKYVDTNVSITTNISYYSLCYIMKTQEDGPAAYVTNNRPQLRWGEESIIGTVNGMPLSIIMPSKPESAAPGVSTGNENTYYTYNGSLTPGVIIAGSSLYRNSGDSRYSPSETLPGSYAVVRSSSYHHTLTYETTQYGGTQPVTVTGREDIYSVVVKALIL